MSSIPLICHHCGVTHILTRTKEIPESAQVIHSNYCCECEDMCYKNSEYYEEWYSDEPLPDPVDPNQLIMEFEY